jgi:hypothetical protein
MCNGGSRLALAVAGDTVKAKTLADDLGKRFPEDTWVEFNFLPSVNAKLALRRKDAANAFEILQHADELGDSEDIPVYVRGEACLAAHLGGQAATEFQKVLDHRLVQRNSPLGDIPIYKQAKAESVGRD